MGVYVKDIELPKEPDEMIELAIFGDGKTLKTGESWRSPVDGKCYYGTSEDMNTYFALAVPPHGRLIDADVLCKVLQKNSEDEWNNKTAPFSWAYAYDCVKDTVENMPTIIPAEEGE